MTKANWIIDVHDLSKTFHGQPAVLNVSFQISPGEIFGFLGPNGAGKTTTIRMLCGLIKPTSGYGHCLGYDIIKQTREIKAHVGYMTQYFSLYNDLTVFENLNFRAKLYGLTDRCKKIEKVMDLVDIKVRKNQQASKLSGGWKQRLSLAAAILHEPLLLLLDEPTAGVDPISRRGFWELVNRLSSEGITILLSSHNMDEVERCHRLAYIAYGQLTMSGTVSEIIQQVGLKTYEVNGPNLPLLAKQLYAIPEIELVTIYCSGLHVCSTNLEAMNAATESFRKHPKYEWKLVCTRLEDVFIWLGSQIKETRYVK